MTKPDSNLEASDVSVSQSQPENAGPQQPREDFDAERAAALASLLARVEAATGADRDLDAALAIRLAGFKPTLRLGHELLGNERIVPAHSPHYTASIDAALALTERLLPGWTVALSIAREAYDVARPQIAYAQMWRNLQPGVGAVDHTRGATPALALLASLLAALIADTARAGS